MKLVREGRESFISVPSFIGGRNRNEGFLAAQLAQHLLFDCVVFFSFKEEGKK
jgi:hypothetical protein